MTQLEVRGGVAGVDVRYDELLGVATLLHQEGLGLLELTAARHRLLVDDDLLASAVLHPGGFARVEAALLAALDGGSGVAVAGAALEVRAAQLTVAVARYRASDALAAEAVEMRRWLLGASAPVLLPLLLGVGAGWAATVAATGGDPLAELEQALVEHPGVLDEMAGSVTGLTAAVRAGLLGPLQAAVDQPFRFVTGATLLPRDLEESAALLALLYGPGVPGTTARRDPSAAAVLVPTGAGDILRRLHHRDDRATVADGRQGDIGVTRIETTDARGRTHVSWVVDIPGTKAWQVVPGERPALNDLASNLELMAGTENARVDAVARVLKDAGAQPEHPVMLVGHSQGGMVAMRAADALAGRFAITHVVTAGSPIGGMKAPAGVQVLSLENQHDLVPHVDGRDNPDSADQVTVLFAHQTGGISGNHGLGTAYVAAARAADRSDDVSVRAWLDGAQAFLAGRDEVTAARTTVYTVSNDLQADGR